jgi:hypothetical protein
MYVDIVDLKFPEYSNGLIFNNPSLLFKTINQLLQINQFSYGFIERFDFNPFPIIPFSFLQNSLGNLTENGYWDKSIVGYFWYQILNPNHVASLNQSKYFSKENAISVFNNGYNTILCPQLDIELMSEDDYCRLYYSLKPLLPPMDKMNVTGILNYFNSNPDKTFSEFFQELKLFWHKLPDYSDLIEFLEHINELYIPYHKYQDEILAEMKKKGYY